MQKMRVSGRALAADLAARLGAAAPPHVYFATVVKLTAALIVAAARGEPIEPGQELLDQIDDGWFERRGLGRFVEGEAGGAEEKIDAPALAELARRMERYDWADVADAGDLFKDLYQALLTRGQRHGRGEYYTPDWLAEHVLNCAGYDCPPAVRVLDPACGSGTFLVKAIARARARGHDAAEITQQIAGFDINPLAVMAARANYLAAISTSLRRGGDIAIPVHLRDSILSPDDPGRYDLVVGNPPWVRWAYMDRAYRDPALWHKYGLFSLRGFAARLGSGEKDLSQLFTYACIDRYLVDGGRLAFVITRTVFKAGGQAEGFRRFRLGPSGAPFAIEAVDDFSRLRAFDGATNLTAVLVARKARETTYPVPYRVWTPRNSFVIAAGTRLPEVLAGTSRDELHARPMDPARPASQWLTLPPTDAGTVDNVLGQNAYRATVGARIEPYGVYLLRILAHERDGVLLVENCHDAGKHSVKPLRLPVEAELVYPLARGRDIDRWRLRPAAHALIVQDPLTRRGIDEAEMRRRYPLALAYLQEFRPLLEARAAFRKYHADGGHPFYSMFNIGPETFAEYRVLWRRMGNAMRSTPAGFVEDPFLGRKLVIASDTVTMVAVQSEREADYLSGLMNSTPARDAIHAFSAGGRGLGTPAVFHRLRIDRFRPGDEVHESIADIAARLRAGEAELERDLDRWAARYWDLPEPPSPPTPQISPSGSECTVSSIRA